MAPLLAGGRQLEQTHVGTGGGEQYRLATPRKPRAQHRDDVGIGDVLRRRRSGLQPAEAAVGEPQHADIFTHGNIRV